jgi:hypothetical protein
MCPSKSELQIGKSWAINSYQAGWCNTWIKVDVSCRKDAGGHYLAMNDASDRLSSYLLHDFAVWLWCDDRAHVQRAL